MDADQTAAYLGVGVKTVKRLITNKKIPAVMVGNTWRVPRRTLDDILDQEGKRNLNGNDRH
ncbi:MAG: helix-turn-helix domain-containing protein [Actinobacteria bacterium]|nr:helix-turn-helix domain-containing protein [Actinomycetota bacterium]